MSKMNPTHKNPNSNSTLTACNSTPNPDSAAIGAVLSCKRVTRGIRRVLRFHGFLPQDVPEGIAEVQCRVLEGARSTGKPIPTDPEAAAKLCVTVAINWCIDRDRRSDKLKGIDEGLCEDPDEYGPLWPADPGRTGTGRWDQGDMTRMIEQFRALVAEGELPEHAEHIVVAVAEGKSHEEIGQELGVSPGTVAHRLVEIRTRFKTKLKYAGLLALLLSVALLVALPPGGSGGLAVNDNGAAGAA